METVE